MNQASIQRFFSAPLAETDPELAAAIRSELGRQQDGIELIASENIVSAAVLEAQGSVLTNKYAECYPGRRYYGGYGYDGYGYDNGAGAAIAGVIIGLAAGAIAANAISGGHRGGSCAQRFRSYNPNTGTYMGYDGRAHRCP